jgi:thiol-disulfide isomerase/thioredoxin
MLNPNLQKDRNKPINSTTVKTENFEMRYLLSIIFLLSLCTFGYSQKEVKVYIFMSEDCIICQSYTPYLNELHDRYIDEGIEIIGVFPNFSSKKKQIDAFKEKYQIEYALQSDYFRSITEQFQATITPEVVVFDESQNAILYRGRIDNTFFRVGKRRRVTTTSELEDALEAIVQDKEILITSTQPIGCIISNKKF